MNTRLLEYRPELEFPALSPNGEHADHYNELASAADLLEVASESELKDYLADLIGKVATAGRALVSTPQGRAVRDALRFALQNAAHGALPLPQGALGGPVIDALSRTSTAALKKHAARMFGLELEGLSPEDQEFELARRFVRFAAATVSEAEEALSHQPGMPPAAAHATVQTALAQAAHRTAPGLLKHSARQGRWQRLGNRIVVHLP